MNAEREDIYSRVTNQIIKAIEAGVKHCRLPWHITEAECFSPINALSKRPYRGVNVLVLWVAAISRGYDSGFWGTYRQWQELGAQVKKGEQATTVVLWKPTERRKDAADDDTGEERRNRGLLARGFSVFNAAQVDGYERPDRKKLSDAERISAAEKVLLGVGAVIQHGGSRSCYNITKDRIELPPFESFRDTFGYYSTLAHELTHWTAAKSRLDRDLSGRFGSVAYAIEELVAELGAAFFCAQCGISVEPRPQHADYIENWLTVLRNDKKALFSAASKAQQALDWLLARAAGQSTESSSAQAA